MSIVLEAFLRTHLCRYLNRDEGEELLGIGHTHHLSSGDCLFSEGDPGDTLYTILDGEIEVVARLPTGDQKVLAVLGFGDVIGEAALIDREPRSAAAIARKESVLWEMSRSHLIGMIRQQPRIAAKFMWAVMESLTTRMRLANSTQAQLTEKLRRLQGARDT